MNFHLLPFGEPAWALRREILREKILARPGPPYDFRGILYLVPNRRSVRTLRALFLNVLEEATGARGCVPPSFETLNRFLERRAFACSKRPVLDRLARGLVLEELCARAAEGFPSVRPGPSLSEMAADALDRLYLYGISDGAWKAQAEDSLPLSLLRAVKSGYESWLDGKGLADPSAAKAAYRPEPGDFKFDAVILDGFYDADPAETRQMKALAQSADCRFLLQAAGLSAPGACGAGRLYSGTDALLSELGFKDDAKEIGGREASLFIGALFGGARLRDTHAEAERGVSRSIRVVGAINQTEEAYFIAREIKTRALDARLDPGRVLVFLPSPEPYLPSLRRAFADYGIPYHVSLGSPLIKTPAARALLDLISLPLERYSFRAVRKALSHLPGSEAGAFEAARKEGVAGKRENWERFAREVRGEAPGLAAALKSLLELTKPFEGRPKTPRGWAEAAVSLLKETGLGSGAPGAAPGSAGLEALLGRAATKSAPAEGRMPLGEFVAFLKRLLREATVREGKDEVSGVRALGRNEILSEPFDVIFAAGLAEGVLPSPHRADLFLPDGLADRLGLPGGMQAVSRDARLFLSLLFSAPEVYLLYPEGSVRGPVPPSPYITALEPFIRAEAIKRTQKWQRPDPPQEALGIGELTRALALHAGVEEARTLAAEAARNIPGFDWPAARKPEAIPAAESLREKKKFSVTELEEYILCGYRYYLTRSLGRPPEDPEEDIDAGTLGTLVHQVLRDFVVARKSGAGAGDPLALLRATAERRFSELPETARNLGWKRWFMESVAPRFVEAEEALLESGFSVTETEEYMEVPVASGDGDTIILTGKIDRVEVDARGDFNIVDYKTGRYPGNKRPLSDQFQLPLYAFMLREKAGGKENARRPASFIYYNLKSDKLRDVVCYDAEVSSGPSKRNKTADEIDGLIRDCLAKALDAVKGIRAGVFNADPKDPRMCLYCEFSDSCRKGPEDEEGEGGDGQDEG